MWSLQIIYFLVLEVLVCGSGGEGGDFSTTVLLLSLGRRSKKNDAKLFFKNNKKQDI
jgi:hypothetical protein